MTIDPHDEPQRQRAVINSQRWAERDRALQQVAVARGAVALVGMIVILAWPDRNSDTTATILGIVVVAIAATTLLTGRSTGTILHTSHRTVIARTAVFTIAGLTLIFWPAATTRVVGLVSGAVLTMMGLAGIYRGLRDRDGSEAALWRGSAMLLAGLIVMLRPEGAVNILLIMLVLVWAGDAAIALLGYAQDDSDVAVPGMSADLLGWIGRFPMDDEQRRQVTAKLYYEGELARDRLWRFGLLTVLSTAIATLGIFVDSTAVVIGAMLIAPLMMPIMGTAAALVSAWPVRAVRALSIVAGGVILAISTAWILASVLAGASAPIISSSQITSRVDPTFIDLLIALAAGAAGAFAVSRADVADSLPGAAIAVALVPPLAVVGITLRVGIYEDVIGSFLLFLTNLVGMILAGALVFLLTGFTPVERLRQRRGDVSRSLTVVALLALMIALPLVLTGRQLTADLVAKGDVESVVEDWIEGTDLQIVELSVNGSSIMVVVAGADTPSNVDDLGVQLEKSIGPDIELDVTVLPTVRLSYESQG